MIDALNELKEKLNSVFGSNIIEQPYKATYEEECEKLSKPWMDMVIKPTRPYEEISTDAVISFDKHWTDTFQLNLYNSALVLSVPERYAAYKARAESLGLSLESIMQTALICGENIDSFLNRLETFCEGGYTSLSFEFDKDHKDPVECTFKFNKSCEDSISSLKKRIKYCKNPMEKKNLEKELNALYKSRKKK